MCFLSFSLTWLVWCLWVWTFYENTGTSINWSENWFSNGRHSCRRPAGNSDFLSYFYSWGDYFKRSILDQVWTVSSGWRVCLLWLPVLAYYRVTFFQKLQMEDPFEYANSTVQWILIPWKVVQALFPVKVHFSEWIDIRHWAHSGVLKIERVLQSSFFPIGKKQDVTGLSVEQYSLYSYACAGNKWTFSLACSHVLGLLGT